VPGVPVHLCQRRVGAATPGELAGWEHSLKNELILGRKLHGESRPSRERLDALLAAAGVRPKLVRELWGSAPEAAPAPP
jgi:hypothetical protein